jgi:hypothetical protein
MFGRILFSLFCLSLLMHLWGVRRDLPYLYEIDEPIFVERAVNMVASGSLNPGWFGNPGSTLMYPLAMIYRVWSEIRYDSAVQSPDQGLRDLFARDFAEFYLIGRLLTIAYGVFCLPLIYLLGKNVFGAGVGLTGAFLSIFSPLVVWHSQIVRTDSAGTFFGLLSLWLCLRAYDRPTIWSWILAGLAIGLSVSTRYFMVVLIPFMLVLSLATSWKRSGSVHRWQVVVMSFAGLAAVAIAFVISTPYFFLDFDTALMNIRGEARTTHLGADGLSPTGNFLWYLTQAIPTAISLPQAVLVLVGVGIALLKKRLKPMLLVGYATIFLIGISLSPLHWARWAIQIMPILALLAGDAILFISERMAGSARMNLRWASALAILVTLAVSVQPAYQLTLLNLQDSNPSTRILAREWIVENIPAQSKIVQETSAAPLSGSDYQVTERILARDHELSDYYQEGFQYIVASSGVYARYFAEPERYAREVAFYQALFQQGELLQQFIPSRTTGGPTIRIYRLQPLQ